MADYSVISSSRIATVGEARDYYERRLASRPQKISCHGKPVTIVFESGATHLYSVEAKEHPVAPAHLVRRWLARDRYDDRVFSLERARLMDAVLATVATFIVSVPGSGAYAGQNRMLHGWVTPHCCMRVVLRPGPRDAFTCVSAYTVTHAVYAAMRRARRAKFPP